MATYSNYPDTAKKAARRALKHKEENGTSCGTSVGWVRANQLASGEALSLNTVKRTFSFLSRAAVYNTGSFTDEDGKDVCGSIMYAAWGGSSMKSWCRGVLNREDERQFIEDIEVRGLMAVQELDDTVVITLKKDPNYGGIQQQPTHTNPQEPGSEAAPDQGVDGGGLSTSDPSGPTRPSGGSTGGDGGLTGGDTGGTKEYKPEKEELRMSDIERRTLTPSSSDLEVRISDEGRTVEGYAAVFGQPTMIGNVEEIVHHGAFDNRLTDDVVALFNHDMNMPLARSTNGQGTLEMKVDEHGLYYKFELGGQTYAKDLAESIKRGDVRGSSFGFVVREDDYEKKDDGTYRRNIRSVGRIVDVSPVVSPAYPQTSVKMRDAIAALEEAEVEIPQPETENPPTPTPKRNVAEAILSIHQFNSPS